MKTVEANKKQTLRNEEKEAFFQQMENNREVFNEAIENILTLVVSDPVLTSQVAGLIESDYHPLYLALINSQQQVENNESPSCCHTPES